MTRVLVLGAGVSGMAAARLARGKGMAVTVYDRQPYESVIEEGFHEATTQIVRPHG